MLQTLFVVFIGVVIFQFIYYVIIFGQFSFKKITENENFKKVPVSVIICAKNEGENVQQYVPLLAKQNYPDFEIVLIDDASRDETLEIFEQFEKQYANVKLVKVENNEAFWGNKKFALTMGIKAASHSTLLFTDADCYPNSTNWISEMSSCFVEDKTVVLGYGAYEKIEGSFINKIIRFETLLAATQYLSWAIVGKPYMGVGRNLAYKKEAFFDADGFVKHMKIRSGDDDLFVNEVATKENAAICVSEDSFTYSQPKLSFQTWFAQKRRHASTAQYYKMFDKVQLGLFYCSQLLFFILLAVLLAFLYEWQIVVGLLTARYLFTWTSLGFSAGKLIEKDVMYWYPVLEIVLIFTQLNVFLTNSISKPIHWK